MVTLYVNHATKLNQSMKSCDICRSYNSLCTKPIHILRVSKTKLMAYFYVLDKKKIFEIKVPILFQPHRYKISSATDGGH